MARKFVDPEDDDLDGVIKMMENESKNCVHCAHYVGRRDGRESCAAFVKGIPTAIFLGEVVHDKRMFQQKNNLVFTGK
jgi:hypothetical protein